MKEEKKSPQQILDQAREEFEKLIQAYGNNIYSWYPKRYDTESVKKISDWHTSTLKAFIEAEIARLEGEKRGKPADNEFTRHQVEGYNQSIDDQITYLKELKI